jgi:hypothetical protein
VSRRDRFFEIFIARKKFGVEGIKVNNLPGDDFLFTGSFIKKVYLTL